MTHGRWFAAIEADFPVNPEIFRRLIDLIALLKTIGPRGGQAAGWAAYSLASPRGRSLLRAGSLIYYATDE